MSAAPNSRRTVAEINFGEGAATGFNIGNRSIHQFWHLFSAQFRSVLLAPQRRPDSGKVAWTWREPAENAPLTPQELALVRQRLSEASRLLTGGGAGKGLLDEGAAGGLDGQVREKVGDMIAQLTAQGDQLLAGFVCRTDTGPMVHSWGAATPAKPHYPGASEGALGGTVFLGADRVAGLTVVLENRSGGFVARTKSGEAGAFSFQNVAPGNYRLRVTGRGEFPPGGVAVAMERESITGLELRGKAPAEAGGAAAAATSATPPQPAPPASRTTRRLLAALALLLVAGGGVYYWRTSRPTGGTGADGTIASGWQSAGRQVGGPAGPEVSVEARTHGRDEHWSDLKPAPSLPSAPGAAGHPGSKPTGSSPASAKSSAAKSSLMGAPAPAPADHPEGELTPAPEKSSGPTGPEKSGPALSAASDKVKSASEPGIKGAAAATTVAARDATDRADPPDESATVKAEKGAEAAAEKAKARNPRAGTPASFAPAIEAPDETAPAGGTPSATGSAPSTVSAATSGLPSAPAAGKSPGNAAANESAPSAASTAPDAPNAAATGDNAISSRGRIAPKPPAPTRKPSHILSTNPGAPSATASAPPDPESNPADNPANPDDASGNYPAKPPAPTKRPASATAPEPQPAREGAPRPPAAEEPATPSAASAAAKSPPRRAAALADKKNPTAPKVDSPERAPEDSAVPATPDSSAPEKETVTPTLAKSPRKTPPAKSAASSSSVESTSDAPAESAPGPSPGASASAVSASSLVPLGRVDATRWSPRQVRDVILPTRPVLATEDDAVEILRQKTRREQAARIPVAFRQPAVAHGLAVEFPVNRSAGLPRWHDAGGVEPAGATVQGSRAEVACAMVSPARPADYILSYPDGAEIARVHVDESGAPSLTAAANVRGWYWVGVESGAGAAPSLSPESTPPGWRLLSGANVPATWPQGDRWPGGRGHRIDLPLAGAAVKHTHALALVDPATGWALVSNIIVGPDR